MRYVNKPMTKRNFEEETQVCLFVCHRRRCKSRVEWQRQRP